jgi:hypothetical protein
VNHDEPFDQWRRPPRDAPHGDALVRYALSAMYGERGLTFIALA